MGQADSVGADYGQFFEAIAKQNVLTDFYQRRDVIICPARELYDAQLAEYDLPRVTDRLISRQGLLSDVDRARLRRRAHDYMGRALLCGRSLVPALFGAWDWTPRPHRPVTVRYLQCRFRGAASFDLLPADDAQDYRDWLGQLGLADAPTDAYRGAGEFLNADLMLWLEYKGQHRLVCVDFSAHTMASLANVHDLGQIEDLERLVMRDTLYTLNKSHFAGLNVSVSGASWARLSSGISAHLAAFATRDKESCKLIQAGSYLDSLLCFLEAHDLLPQDLICLAIGLSDRGRSTIVATPQQRVLLERCHTEYKAVAPYLHQEHRDLAAEREGLVRAIGRSTARLFPTGGRGFVHEILEQAARPTGRVSHEEGLEGFLQMGDSVPPEVLARYGLEAPLSLYDAHAALERRALEDPHILFPVLVGCPGIGKTTTMRDHVVSCFDKGEGVLLVYISGRIHVNYDILQKFKHKFEGPDADPRYVGLLTNREIIEHNGGRMTVQIWQAGQKSFRLGGVDFLDAESVARNAMEAHGASKSVDRESGSTVRERRAGEAGVLQSLCTAAGLLQSRAQEPLVIVCAVTLQSLRQTSVGSDTLQHLPLLLQGNTAGELLPAELRKLAGRLRHIIFMLDEVAGDPSGAPFFRGVSHFVRTKRELEHYGFLPKIVLADASIVDAGVLCTQFRLDRALPTPDRFFVGLFEAATSERMTPLFQERFSMASPDDAVLINANSYPAARLNLRYHVRLGQVADPTPLSARAVREAGRQERRDLKGGLNEDMEHDILAALLGHGPDYGCIVYLQDKAGLKRLIDRLTEALRAAGRPFEKDQQYLQIHASLTERDRRLVVERGKSVQVIFMTSSASRGLSFPQVREYFIGVPQFQVERNMMEVLQAIARGRGDPAIDREPKTINFYITDHIDASGPDPSWAARESALNTIQVLFLLKAAVLTRILGACPLHDLHAVVIPAGSTALAGRIGSFHDTLKGFYDDVQSEITKNPGDGSLRALCRSLEPLLSSLLVQVASLPTDAQGKARSSFLDFVHTVDGPELERLLDRGGALLRQKDPLPDVFVAGGLVIVPLDGVVQTTHAFSLARVIAPHVHESKLLGGLYHLAQARDRYPGSLCTTARKVYKFLKEELAEAQETQYMQHSEAGSPEQDYCVFPISALVARDTFAAHYAQLARLREEGQTSEVAFLPLMRQYLRVLCSYTNDLPAKETFTVLPHMTFTSGDLAGRQRQEFTDGANLSSLEMNITNMLLAGGDDPG